MCEQDYEDKKIGDYKIFVSLQALNSNFRPGANRAYICVQYVSSSKFLVHGFLVNIFLELFQVSIW